MNRQLFIFIAIALPPAVFGGTVEDVSLPPNGPSRGITLGPGDAIVIPVCPTLAQIAAGWLALKPGMGVPAIVRLIGLPVMVETIRESFEVWQYPDGTLYLKDRKLIAWRENLAGPAMCR